MRIIWVLLLPLHLIWSKVALNMSGYVIEMCKRFGVAVKQSVTTPMEKHFQAVLENASPADEVFVLISLVCIA